ncbi:MAG: hypothetical protein Q8S14_05285 [Algoriphagus sp.]|uniref:hypothetical protein n=1 Tax=Algoriphagus sp. TaxID=1872435 RepID=UPI0027304600|nr:hypothetical protein [Algoriphagus sp.]MDP2040968.1 hypothetical protein [Algoriphagus sp.]MDP3471268.1 hypothetical protein [Algoriphagus sp.]
MNEARNNRIKNLLIFIFFLFVAQGCQEFIHDSFDTFQGKTLTKTGDPIANLRLNLYSGSSLVYSFTTGSQGEFRVVLPSKNINTSYSMTVREPFFFEINRFDQIFTDNSLMLDPSLRTANGVIDLGELILVEK